MEVPFRSHQFKVGTWAFMSVFCPYTNGCEYTGMDTKKDWKVVESPSLEQLKKRLDMALSAVLWLIRLDLSILEVLSNLNYAMILCYEKVAPLSIYLLSPF